MKIQLLTTRQVRGINAAWNNQNPLVSGAIFIAHDDGGTGLDILAAAICRDDPNANRDAARERVKSELADAARDAFEFGGIMVTP